MKKDENGCFVGLVEQAIVGTPVIWNDDSECHGVIEEIFPGKGKHATHCGNLYACRFTYDSPEDCDPTETYTRTFDSYSLGRELKLHDTLHPDLK